MAIILLLLTLLLYSFRMNTDFIDLRAATASDSDALATIHSAAWLGAYRGLLNGVDLDRLIARRPPQWWRQALARGVQIKVLQVGGETVGYGTYGPCRLSSLGCEGEIYELYLLPEHQGLGFGKQLFRAIQQELANRHLSGLAVQVLTLNDPAKAFYRALGGKLSATSSHIIKGKAYDLSIYSWPDDI
ncbi:GNAT family N-acetyltransferase [Roseibium sp.]|uniref:GNAT family N-acetyltransferase n=1 Tax=Roseibium sp. TaxID=1936156 RepID=UPI003A980E84